MGAAPDGFPYPCPPRNPWSNFRASALQRFRDPPSEILFIPLILSRLRPSAFDPPAHNVRKNHSTVASTARFACPFSGANTSNT